MVGSPSLTLGRARAGALSVHYVAAPLVRDVVYICD